MGAVYKAQHADLRRFSAVKILPTTMAERSENAVRRFMREARSAAVLSHPNIVTVHNVGEADGYRFIEMEFVDGESVQDRLRREGKLSVEEATRIIRDTANALGSAHAKNIVHRDIKPGNIMLGEDGAVKVADFGLAKDVLEDSLVTQEGRGGIGTPSFMSPEQCDGDPLDGRSDIYSLGVTYFYLLTGDLPFKADSSLSVMLKHKTAPIPDPRQLDSSLPDAVSFIITKAMAKDTGDRYQTCEEMIEHLDGVMSSVAPAASPEPPKSVPGAVVTGPTTPPSERRNVLGPIAAAASIVLVLGLLVWAVMAKKTKGREGTRVESPAAETTTGGKAVVRDPKRGVQQPGKAYRPSRISDKLPPSFHRAFIVPTTSQDQYGNPVRRGTDPVTGYPNEVWLKEPKMEFVLIPAGEFMMGSSITPEEVIRRYHSRLKTSYFKFRDEHPQHRVRITKPFYLAKYEVTNAQYRAFKRDHDSKEYKGQSLNGEKQPVVYVSWEDAMGYCKWLTQRSGAQVGLPTEAQWEYACRAGTRAVHYWGDKLDPAYGNFADKNTSFDWRDKELNDGHAVTAPVGRYRPNAFGLHDMLGNVWEWCADWYDEAYYKGRSSADPQSPSTGTARVLRGGSWDDLPSSLRSAGRSWGRPGSRNGRLGLRCVVSVVFVR